MMRPTRRDLSPGAAAVALVLPGARAPTGRNRAWIGRYPSPVCTPRPKGLSWIAPDIPLYPQPNVDHARLPRTA